MEASKEILTELQEIAPFLGKAGVSRIPYTVPAGYFTDFAEILMNRIHLEAGGISDLSSKQEITGISPLLAGLQKKNPYQVPEGYFEELKEKIPLTIPSKLIAVTTLSVLPKNGSAPVKRISFPMRIVRYATAACIVGLIGIATFNIKYHQSDPINGLTTVSDQDMANFLDAADVHWTADSSASETASTEFNDNEIHELLSSVPDVELEQYSPPLAEEKRSVN